MTDYITVPVSNIPDNLVYEGSNYGEKNTATAYYTDADKMRFVDGKPQVLGGSQAVTLLTTDRNAVTSFGAASGTPNSTFKYSYNGTNYAIVGTNRAVFAWNRDTNAVFNITPLTGSTTAIANSLATQFDTLGTNPIATTNGSSTVTVTHSSHGLRTGDSITIAGVPGAINNIPAAQLNATHTVTVLTTSTYTVTVATSANATGSGGGAAVTVGTGRIRVTHAAHGFSANLKVKLAGAADTGGILAANINTEFVIRAVTTNTFDVYASTNATSSVSSGGGASTTDEIQICATGANINNERIWSFGLFNDYLILCPGKQGKIYEWLGVTTTAATQVSGSPAENDWIFERNGRIVSLGCTVNGGAYAANNVRACKVADRTTWTPGVASGFEDRKEGVDSWIASSTAGGVDILFSNNNKVFYFEDVGGSDSYKYTDITANTGLIAPKAAIEINGTCYFVGEDNIYRIVGTNAEPLPNNLLRDWIFKNLDRDFSYRTWLEYRELHNELHVHFYHDSYFGMAYVIHNLQRGNWINGTYNRSAAFNDAPNYFGFNSSGTLYTHETGFTHDSFLGDIACPYIDTNFRAIGDSSNRVLLKGMEPDSIATGNIAVYVFGKDRAQQAATQYQDEFNGDAWYITNTQQKLEYRIKTRYWKYRFAATSSYDTPNNAFFRLSGWKEFIKPAGKR